LRRPVRRARNEEETPPDSSANAKEESSRE
jgi:hypothetical protein